MKKIKFIICFCLILTMFYCSKEKIVEKDEVILTEENGKNSDQKKSSLNLSEAEITQKVKELMDSEKFSWVTNAIIIGAINKANSQNLTRKLDDIKKLDEQWQNTQGIDNNIKSFLENDASKFLQKIKEESQGLYSDIFIMDYQGCIVALTDKTSDFWQGDEDKFIKSYNNSNGGRFIDKIEFDESTQENIIQASVSVEDTSTKKVIGAITIGININNM